MPCLTSPRPTTAVNDGSNPWRGAVTLLASEDPRGLAGGTHPVVARVVLDLGQPERLEHRGHVHARSGRAGPSSGRTSRRPGCPPRAPRPRRCRRRRASAHRRRRAASSRRGLSASCGDRRCSAGGSATRSCRPGSTSAGGSSASSRKASNSDDSGGVLRIQGASRVPLPAGVMSAPRSFACSPLPT